MPHHFPICRALLLTTLVVTSAAACSPRTAAPGTTSPPDQSPVQVVSGLLAAVDEGRFDDAATLTDTTQAALLTLVEGANATEVADVVENGSPAVVANFWSGFAQTLDTSFEPAEMTIEAAETVSEGGSRFVSVTLEPGEGETRTIVLRRDGPWKVDLFATFGTVLAERLIPRVESVLSSANPDASIVLGYLRESADSLRVAAADPALPPNIHQSLLALIERITRAAP